MAEENERKNAELEVHRYEILAQIEEWLDVPMLVLSFVWLGLVIVEMVGELSPLLDLLITGIWLLFILEFLLELLLAPDRLAYLKRNWLVALSLIAPAFRVLRLARVLSAARAARTLTLVRVFGSLNYNLRALRNAMRRRGFGYVVMITLLVVALGAAGMYFFENNTADAARMPSYGYAVWWTAMLMTTIGADYSAHSAAGRLLTFLLALYATGVFGYITASLATLFIGREAADKKGAVAGEQSVQALHSEVQALRAEIAALRRDLSDG